MKLKFTGIFFSPRKVDDEIDQQFCLHGCFKSQHILENQLLNVYYTSRYEAERIF